RWLLDSLDDPQLAEQAMALLLHFQGPDLLRTDEHPGVVVPHPVVVLQNALAKMLALPVEVSYTLPEALRALGSQFRYQRKDYYPSPLGRGLRSAGIPAVWHGGKPALLARLRQEARLCLCAQRALLWDLRRHGPEHLFAWAPRFQMPPPAALNDPLLSRLAFF